MNGVSHSPLEPVSEEDVAAVAATTRLLDLPAAR